MSSQPKKWGHDEKRGWFLQQTVQRSYRDDVVSKIQALSQNLEVIEYGVLSIAPEKYPLFLMKTRPWSTRKPTVLITGGVHGYETSGVHGALRFAASKSFDYSEKFNIAIAPCVSPWAYETINRWNPEALDPNRSFLANSNCEEANALMRAVKALPSRTQVTQQGQYALLAHFDLHETTNSDNTVFRPALAQRDGIEQAIWDIPDGFYVVGDEENPTEAFQQAIIQAVKKVTHIAPADCDKRIIGEPAEHEGVIYYAAKKLGLSMGFSDSRFCTTTEVYPDSAKVDAEDCILAQMAAIVGGLDYIKAQLHSQQSAEISE